MIKICENCKNEWNAARASKRFCGERCSKEFFSIKPRKCKRADCLVVFRPSQSVRVYCSHSCSAKVTNVERGPVNKKEDAQKYRTCKTCGKNQIAFNRALCDSCRTRGPLERADVYIPKWVSGLVDGSDKNGHIKYMCVKYLKDNAGWKCTSASCYVPGGWGVPNAVTGKPILTVNHIDGNWKNNVIDNLEVLCYNCHTLTPTFGSLNIGSPSGSRPYAEARKR